MPVTRMARAPRSYRSSMTRLRLLARGPSRGRPPSRSLCSGETVGDSRPGRERDGLLDELDAARRSPSARTRGRPGRPAAGGSAPRPGRVVAGAAGAADQHGLGAAGSARRRSPGRPLRSVVPVSTTSAITSATPSSIGGLDGAVEADDACALDAAAAQVAARPARRSRWRPGGRRGPRRRSRVAGPARRSGRWSGAKPSGRSSSAVGTRESSSRSRPVMPTSSVPEPT